jgi:hypothetical protein
MESVIRKSVTAVATCVAGPLFQENGLDASAVDLKIERRWSLRVGRERLSRAKIEPG